MSSATLSLKVSNPARIPILYVILGVLVAISVVPMYFYSAKVESDNSKTLKTNEKLLQNTVTRSLADDISQHEASLRLMLANLSAAIQIASGGDIGGRHVERSELRALLENFVSSSDDIAYATLLNAQAKAALDDVALRLKSDQEAKAVIVGEYAAGEKAGKRLAAQRAVNAKAYLTQGEAGQRIDPSRIEVRTGNGGEMKDENWIVPADATFKNEGTDPIDETKVKPDQSFGTSHAAAPAKKKAAKKAAAPAR